MGALFSAANASMPHPAQLSIDAPPFASSLHNAQSPRRNRVGARLSIARLRAQSEASRIAPLLPGDNAFGASVMPLTPWLCER